MIYHVLPELEPFSTYRGGALAKNVANLMKIHETRSVVCGENDDTWGLAKDRIILVPGLSLYAKLKGRRYLPLPISNAILRHAFRPLLLRLQPGDIVWVHNQPVFSAALQRPVHKKGARFVHHFHDPNVTPQIEKALRSFIPDAYIFISQALRQEWLNRFPAFKNTHILYNGVDDTLFYPSPAPRAQQNPAPVVLYVGRLQPEKGVHNLLEAMKILEQRNVHVQCKVVGSSFAGGSKPTPYIKSLQDSRPSNVSFEGFRDKRGIADEFRAADIFCCPSIWQEALGMVNVEAMACGVPVVATRVGGIPELAAEGGIVLVSPDSAVELADAIQKLVEDPALRASVAEQGLESFRRRFTWTIIGRHYAEFVAQL